MSRDDATLLVVDVQEKLLRAMREPQRLTWNIARLLDGARLLGVAATATEQYPQGLGPTVASLAERLGQQAAAVHEKLAFSCWGCEALRKQLEQLDRPNVLICGMETHVCVQQTTLDLLAAGYRVFVAVDAVASRSTLDHDVALRRMEAHGATLTTVEAALFEWCATAGTPEFKAISQLVKQTLPTETHS